MSKREPSETIAVFEYIPSGVKHYYKSTVLGGIYRQVDGGMARGNTHDTMRWDSDDVSKGSMRVLQSPSTLYHVWHVCMCDKCVLVGGRVFDHSQGAWNEHLRYVANEDLFTFPTAQSEVTR